MVIFLKRPVIVTVAGQSQSGFDGAEQKQRDDHQRDKTEKPFAARRWRIFLAAPAGQTARCGALRLSSRL